MTANYSSIHRLLLSVLMSLAWACTLQVDMTIAEDARTSHGWTDYFRTEVARIADQSQKDMAQVTPENWETLRANWRRELRLMLGLEPLPDRGDLNATITGTWNHDGLTIQRLHYQSSPGLYVAANLYLPAGDAPKDGWPVVLYVCGHAKVESYGRILGNKTGYHHHGLWFARHGTACLMIDTVQLGELHGEHHGTYKLGRWDWISRGYTPAGVEAWNAIRAIDMLEGWPGIDATRLGITGRSGGGAYSWFAAALDDRIRVAVPVAGITDLQNHIVDHCVEGHCDCMYMVNYFEWDYGKLASLVAPRPLLLANSDNDRIFPLSGVMRIHQILKEHYSRLAVPDNYGLLVTPGPHLDTQELQVGAFKWLMRNLHGKDVVIDEAAVKELRPEQLAVFDRETPSDERVAEVGSWFVPGPQAAQLPSNPEELIAALKDTSLRKPLSELKQQRPWRVLASGNQGEQPWQIIMEERTVGPSCKYLIVGNPKLTKVRVHFDAKIAGSDAIEVGEFGRLLDQPAIASKIADQDDWLDMFVLTRWQADAGPDKVKDRSQLARRFYLLGQMPDQSQLIDLLGALGYLNSVGSTELKITAAGRTAPIVLLAAMIAKSGVAPGLAIVQQIDLTSYPSDSVNAPSLPGWLRGTTMEHLRQLAGQVCVISEQHRSIDWNQEQLVDTASEPQQATGFKMVELKSESVDVWVRATRWSLANLADMPKLTFALPAKTGKQNQQPQLPQTGVDGLQYAVPGVDAEVRVGYRKAGTEAWSYTDWTRVTSSTDFSALVHLENLQSDTSYELRTQARSPAGEIASTLTGSFRTLPGSAKAGEGGFRLAVGTCQDFPDRDGPHGFDMYRSMLDRHVNAFVMAGDVVYYDEAARSVALANYHWQRTYSLPTVHLFHRQVPTYFLKDDHDTYVNDSWPGTRFPWTEAFTFEDGQRLFKYQTGLPDPAYRTVRLTRELQIWLMEGRDYRSPNTQPDGPNKTIWGAEQKAWLKETLEQSDALFRVVISPTPIVGPDRAGKHDNHSNQDFATEGGEIRKMLASFSNVVSVCGDRHWQYHSVDPETGLHEFSVGPASQRHAGGWDPKDFRQGIHQFLRVGGGYLEIELQVDPRPKLTLRHLDSYGNEKHMHVLQ